MDYPQTAQDKPHPQTLLTAIDSATPESATVQRPVESHPGQQFSEVGLDQKTNKTFTCAQTTNTVARGLILNHALGDEGRVLRRHCYQPAVTRYQLANLVKLMIARCHV